MTCECPHPMKTLLRLLPLFALAFVSLHAAEDKAIAAARAADNERMAATKAADRSRLDAILSDQLHYAHSSGKIDTKASYIESLVTHSTVYESFEYKQQDFTVAAPGVVLMTGHVIVKVISNGAHLENDLNILAVWREEKGKWRFLAWQASKNPTDAAPAKK
jgi:hypothetical protein